MERQIIQTGVKISISIHKTNFFFFGGGGGKGGEGGLKNTNGTICE